MAVTRASARTPTVMKSSRRHGSMATGYEQDEKFPPRRRNSDATARRRSTTRCRSEESDQQGLFEQDERSTAGKKRLVGERCRQREWRQQRQERNRRGRHEGGKRHGRAMRIRSRRRRRQLLDRELLQVAAPRAREPSRRRSR